MKEITKYITGGVIVYPLCIFTVFVLALILTPLGLRPFFEETIKILAFPATVISLNIVYIMIPNPFNYPIPHIILSTAFLAFFGGLIGLIVYVIKLKKRKNKKILVIQ